MSAPAMTGHHANRVIEVRAPRRAQPTRCPPERNHPKCVTTRHRSDEHAVGHTLRTGGTGECRRQPVNPTTSDRSDSTTSKQPARTIPPWRVEGARNRRTRQAVVRRPSVRACGRAATPAAGPRLDPRLGVPAVIAATYHRPVQLFHPADPGEQRRVRDRASLNDPGDLPPRHHLPGTQRDDRRPTVHDHAAGVRRRSPP